MQEEEIKGKWESLPDSPIFVVHAALLHTGKVLLFSGRAEQEESDPNYRLESRVWDPQRGTFTTQEYEDDLFCSGHAFLGDGRLCVVGGANYGMVRATNLFNPITESWTKVANMEKARWYPTVLTLADGRIMAVSGMFEDGIIEIYDPDEDKWQRVTGAERVFPHCSPFVDDRKKDLYPSLHLTPAGVIFYSRAGWRPGGAIWDRSADIRTAYLTLTGPFSGTWTELAKQQYPDRQEGTSVIMIDAMTNPVTTQVFVVGGGLTGITDENMNPRSCEAIDLSALTPSPSWRRISDMNHRRTNVNAVILPNGTILVIGGQDNGKFNRDPHPVYETEIYDPKKDTWTKTASFKYPQQYHSVAVLLPDATVMIAGGIDPDPNHEHPIEGDNNQRFMEKYSPPYLFHGQRPIIDNVPDQISYDSPFQVVTSNASDVESVALLHPCAMTHHTDANQRYIKLEISGHQSNLLTVKAPNDGNVGPPGHYMLFVLNTKGIPSTAKFVRIS